MLAREFRSIMLLTECSVNSSATVKSCSRVDLKHLFLGRDRESNRGTVQRTETKVSSHLYLSSCEGIDISHEG